MGFLSKAGCAALVAAELTATTAFAQQPNPVLQERRAALEALVARSPSPTCRFSAHKGIELMRAFATDEQSAGSVTMANRIAAMCPSDLLPEPVDTTNNVNVVDDYIALLGDSMSPNCKEAVSKLRDEAVANPVMGGFNSLIMVMEATEAEKACAR